MSGNTFGELFRITTFGESHGTAIGCIIDGCPSNLEINKEDIQKELDKRKPGQSSITTQRKEEDKVQILSGVFEGKTIGTPIALLIMNKDHKSNDYSNIKDIFRPSHADWTYYNKYGIKRFVLRFPNITLYHPCPFDHIDGKRRWVSYRWMIQQATEGKPLEIWGNPDCKRDIVYVKDCTQIILGALSASCDGGIYNVGTGVGVTMENQVRGIAEVFAPEGEKIEIRYRADKPDSPEFILDVSKTERELGYRSRYDYLTALRDFKKERELNRFYLLWGKEVDE